MRLTKHLQFMVGMLFLIVPVSAVSVISSPPPELSLNQPGFTLQYSDRGLLCQPQSVLVTAVTANGEVDTRFTGEVRLNGIKSKFSSDDQGKKVIALSATSEGNLSLILENWSVERNRFEGAILRQDLVGEGGISNYLAPIYFRSNGFKVTPVGNGAKMAGDTFELLIQAVSSREGVCEVNTEYGDSRDLKIFKAALHQFESAYMDELSSTSISVGSEDKKISLLDNTAFSAEITLQFTEGKARLPVRYDGIGIFVFTVSEEGTTLSGKSEPIAITPAALSIQAIPNRQSLSQDNHAQSSASDLPPVFGVAGEPFQVQVQALDIRGNPILGFGHELPREKLELKVTQQLPENGQLGILDFCWHYQRDESELCKNVSDDEGISPTLTATVKYSEVGQIALAAAMQDGAYWGSPLVSVSTADNEETRMGRLIPAKIIVLNSNTPPKFQAGCSAPEGQGFTYLGQPIAQNTASLPTVIIKAVNADGGLVQNYMGDFWRITDDFHPEWIWINANETTHLINTNIRVSSPTGNALRDRLISESLIESRSDTSRYQIFQFISEAKLQFYKSEESKTGIPPFDARIVLQYYLFEQDGVPVYLNDGISRAPSPDVVSKGSLLCPRSAQDCAKWAALTIGNPETGIEFVGGNHIYHGRLALGSAARSSLLPMEMPLTVEYYNGEQFVRNTLDNCSQFVNPKTNKPKIKEASFEKNGNQLNALSQKYAQNLTIAGDDISGIFTAGKRLVRIDKDAYTAGADSEPPPYGYMIIQIPMTDDSLKWLKFPWEEGRDYPEARANIGIWEGDPPVIFKTERY